MTGVNEKMIFEAVEWVKLWFPGGLFESQEFRDASITAVSVDER